MIELTHQQHQTLAQNGAFPARVIDRETNVEYVLIPTSIYDRLKTLLSDTLPDAASLINEVMAEDDAGDPHLESYQQFARGPLVKPCLG